MADAICSMDKGFYCHKENRMIRVLHVTSIGENRTDVVIPTQAVVDADPSLKLEVVKQGTKDEHTWFRASRPMDLPTTVEELVAHFASKGEVEIKVNDGDTHFGEERKIKVPYLVAVAFDSMKLEQNAKTCKEFKAVTSPAVKADKALGAIMARPDMIDQLNELKGYLDAGGNRQDWLVKWYDENVA